MIDKQNRKLFVKGVEEIILQHGVFIEERNDRKVFRVKTNKTYLELYLYGEDDHKHLFSVFGKFDKPSPFIGNPFSGKYNLHSTEVNIDAALEVFKLYLSLGIKNN